MKKFIIVETTYPNLKAAEKLAEILLSQKLAACIHFCKIESRYVWQEKITKDQEILVRIKTENSLFSKVEKIIKSNHSYELPQIVAIEIDRASKSYLQWLESSLKTGK